MECPNCNKIYDDGFNFCPYCGIKKPAPKICPICELEPDLEFSFCPKCGTELIKESDFITAKRYFEEGNKSYYESHGEEGLESFFKSVEIVPKKWAGKITERIMDNGFDRIYIFFDDSIYQKRLNFCEKVLCLESDNPFFWELKGDCLQNLRKIKEAKECYEKSKKLYDYELEYYGKKWECCGDEIEFCDYYIDLDESKHRCLNLLEIVNEILEKMKEFDEKLEIDPNNIELLEEKLDFLEEKFLYEDTIECYDKLLELKPNNHDYLHNKGFSLYRLKQYEESIKYYDLAIELKPIELKPYDYFTWKDKGDSLKEWGKNDEALECYKKSLECCDNYIETEPEDYYNWIWKGDFLNQLGRYEESLECYDKAMELNPYSKYFWKKKGKVLEKLGRDEEAKKCFEKANS